MSSSTRLHLALLAACACTALANGSSCAPHVTTTQTTTQTTTHEQAIGALRTFAPGALVVPMDNALQPQALLSAYGLVFDLLRHGVPVHHVIEPAKAYGDVDLQVAARNFDASGGGSERRYAGGPFVVDVADVDVAAPLVRAWRARQSGAGGNPTIVQETTADVEAPVARTLHVAPRIAVLVDGNEELAFAALNAAQMPQSDGSAWPSSRRGDYADEPDVVSRAAVAGPNDDDDADGALHDGDAPRFCVFASMHEDGDGPDTAEVVRETRLWLTSSPATHAFLQCASTLTFENDDSGHFLTTEGLREDGARPDPVAVVAPADPLVQSTGTITATAGPVADLALDDDSALHAGARVLAHESERAPGGGMMWLSGRADGDVSAGRVSYLTGHEYDPRIASERNALRFFFNAILQSGCTSLDDAGPRIAVTATSPLLTSESALPFTFVVQNAGRGHADDVTLTVALPAGTRFGASSDQGTLVGGDVVWRLGRLLPGASRAVSLEVLADVDGLYTARATTALTSFLTTLAGGSASSSTTRDTAAPETTIVAGPAATTSTRRAVFDLASDEPATFTCALDDGPFVACDDPAVLTVQAGSHTLRARAVDAAGNGDPTPARWDWSVDDTNAAPRAQDDAVVIDEDGAAIAIDVTDNDDDDDGDALVVDAVGDAGPAGLVTLVNGVPTFSPAPDFAGLANFSYVVVDGRGGSDNAVVRIEVRPVNDPPVARDDAFTLLAGATTTLAVLANDDDVDGDALRVVSVGAVVGGQVSVVALPSGTELRFVAPAFGGTATLRYAVDDGVGARAQASVRITIDGPPPPDGGDDGGDDDSDDDGLADDVEVALGTDPLTADSDADGVLDGVEAPDGEPTDADSDGVIDALDSDSDGDGLLDAVEREADPDDDGTPARLDADSDGDGVPDGTGVDDDDDSDGDGDGTPAFLDATGGDGGGDGGGSGGDGGGGGGGDDTSNGLPDDVSASGAGVGALVGCDAAGGARAPFAPAVLLALLARRRRAARTGTQEPRAPLVDGHR